MLEVKRLAADRIVLIRLCQKLLELLDSQIKHSEKVILTHKAIHDEGSKIVELCKEQ